MRDGFGEIDGTIPLLAVTFTGKNTVPDGGPTLAIMGIAIVAFLFLYSVIENDAKRQRTARWQ